MLYNLKNLMREFIILLILLILNVEQAPAQKYSEEAKSYFQEIALGSEYGNSQDKTIKKWVKDIYLFVPQNIPTHLNTELNKIINELNSLIQPIKIYKTNQIERSNLKLYIGTANEYIKAEPRARKLAANNLGLFYVYPNERGEIESGSVFLDTERLKAQDTQKHLLREELTQALGLMNDSEKYPNSIFYQKWSRTNEFSDLDKEVIKILYSPKIKSGLSQYKTNIILQNM